MDSIYGNSINPNEKTKSTNPIDFSWKMGRGIPRGIGFGSPGACEGFRDAPDARSADILKNRKNPEIVISPRKRFPQK